MDDFSWGNTRLAIDSNDSTKAQLKLLEAERFDPASVPLVKWSDYEAAHHALEEDAKSVTSNFTANTRNSLITRPTKPLHIGNRDSYVSHAMMNRQSLAMTEIPLEVRFPSDDEILAEVRHILATTDLMKVTKKSVRDTLSRLFGTDMTPKKDYIHRCIDLILKGE